MQGWQGADHDGAPMVVVCSAATELALFLRHLLEGEGLTVDIATTQEQALDRMVAEPSVVVLIDGELGAALSLCRRLQEEGKRRSVRVLVLFKIEALDDYPAFLAAGMDEGLVRPVEPGVILAAVRRRARQFSALPVDGLLNFCDVEIDMGARRVWRRGLEIRLTRIEFELMAFMVRRPKTVFTRQELIAGAWPKGVFVDPRTVTIHIGRLRRRLMENGFPDLIRTVRGSGYGLDEPNPGQDDF